MWQKSSFVKNLTNFSQNIAPICPVKCQKMSVYTTKINKKFFQKNVSLHDKNSFQKRQKQKFKNIFINKNIFIKNFKEKC